MLFPAKISEDSPWKQETATSRLDADTENSTQEAIDLYFSHHHKITSPEDLPRTNVQNDRGSLSIQTNASHMTIEDLGGSPELRGKSITEEKETTQSLKGLFYLHVLIYILEARSGVHKWAETTLHLTPN